MRNFVRRALGRPSRAGPSSAPSPSASPSPSGAMPSPAAAVTRRRRPRGIVGAAMSFPARRAATVEAEGGSLVTMPVRRGRDGGEVNRRAAVYYDGEGGGDPDPDADMDEEGGVVHRERQRAIHEAEERAWRAGAGARAAERSARFENTQRTRQNDLRHDETSPVEQNDSIPSNTRTLHPSDTDSTFGDPVDTVSLSSTSSSTTATPAPSPTPTPPSPPRAPPRRSSSAREPAASSDLSVDTRSSSGSDMADERLRPPHTPHRLSNVSLRSRLPVPVIQDSPYLSSHTPRNTPRASLRSIDTAVYDAYLDSLIDAARDRAHGLHAVVDSLRDSDGNPVIIEQAALAIGMLAAHDAASRDFLGKFNAVEWLLQCLSVRVKARYDQTFIANRVVYAIANLLHGSPRNVKVFEEVGGPLKLGKAAASKRYVHAPEIPKNALQALSELKYHHAATIGATTDAPDGNATSQPQPPPEQQGASVAERVTNYILQAIRLHEARADVQERGLDALRTLLARARPEGLEQTLLEESVLAAARACRLYEGSAAVQWQCLTLFCDLDGMYDDIFSLDWDIQCFFNALSFLVAQCKERRGGEGGLLPLIRRATGVASRLGWRNKEMKDGAVEAGAIETMLEALEACGEDADTVDNICSILRNLLHSNEGQHRLKHAGAACSVLAGIETANLNSATSFAAGG